MDKIEIWFMVCDINNHERIDSYMPPPTSKTEHAQMEDDISCYDIS